ncbi:MAG TPA: hypothetical protein VHN55_05580 [Sphingomicrobium sp.]|nr:hypothetical protein [Sphingomicrobium sp.]
MVTESLPWLPPFGRNDFLIVANPTDRLEKQIFVNLEERKNVCHANPQRPQALRQACAAAAAGREALPGPLERLVKVPDEIGPEVWWSYFRPTEKPGAAPQIVVSCTSMEGSLIPAKCNRMDSYQDLIVTYSIDERDLPRLVAIDRKIDQLLASWEL